MAASLHLFFRFLEIIFFVGLVGSLLVIMITTVEDFAVLFEKDEPAPGTATSRLDVSHESLAHASYTNVGD